MMERQPASSRNAALTMLWNWQLVPSIVPVKCFFKRQENVLWLLAFPVGRLVGGNAQHWRVILPLR
jgi:hypothetical protein